jgi:hypothetical protein
VIVQAHIVLAIFQTESVPIVKTIVLLGKVVLSIVFVPAVSVPLENVLLLQNLSLEALVILIQLAKVDIVYLENVLLLHHSQHALVTMIVLVVKNVEAR